MRQLSRNLLDNDFYIGQLSVGNVINFWHKMLYFVDDNLQLVFVCPQGYKKWIFKFDEYLQLLVSPIFELNDIDYFHCHLILNIGDIDCLIDECIQEALGVFLKQSFIRKKEL